MIDQTIGQVQLTQTVLHQSLECWQALHNPNCMCSHSKNPMLPTVKGVYCFEASSITVCQNPAFKSKQEKYTAPTRFWIAFCICRSGSESILVLTFNLWKSMQKLRPPSFLHTSTKALHHGLWLGQIVPASNISFIWGQTLSAIGGGTLQNLSLKGSPSVTLISCFTRSVQPNYLPSKEKMLWCSASRVHVAAQFLVDHPSRPDKSSCWKSTSFLCSTDISALWIPSILSGFSNVPSTTPTWGMAFAAMTWMILTFLAMVIRAVVRFLTKTVTHLLPAAISV